MKEEQWPASKVKLWAIDKIVPYDTNPRTHPEAQINLIAASMKEDGVIAPILVDEDGVIIYGHGRRLAALKNKFPRYPVVQAIGWPEERKRKVRLTDNSFADLSAWDDKLLAGELNVLSGAGIDMKLLGFTGDQLAGFGFNVAEGDFPQLSTADRAPFQQLTFTLHDSQVEIVKAAMNAAKASGAFKGPNENSNGNALARICKFYKDASEREKSAGGPDPKGDGKRADKKAPLQRKGRRK